MQEFDPHVLEEKSIPPPEEFRKHAHVKSLEEYRKLHERADQDPEGFWGEQARMLDWVVPPSQLRRPAPREKGQQACASVGG
jgi:hypothetical protein